MTAIIFDFDGPLVDSYPAHMQYMSDKGRQLGVNVRLPERFKEFSFPIGNLFRTAGFPEAHIKELVLDYFTRFPEEYTLPLVEGIPEMLIKLEEADIQLGIVTSNVALTVRKALGQYWDLFSIILTSDEFKLKEDALRHALHFFKRRYGFVWEKYNLQRKTPYVADELRDHQVAEIIGMPFIGVPWGWQITREHTGFKVVRDVSELTDLLLNWRRTLGVD
ncbi:HAD family hydrolase [Candidatus Woesearchaeota archaeon]|nr:HAD family hydrolase [Candidatus Woesearchaeota archaeon]